MAKNSAGKTSDLTDQQRAALEAQGVSVALSAGAGCGKTFVLTERFLRELQPDNEGARPGERLASTIAITFTERATREMRERIRRAVEKRLRDCPEPEAEYWWALLRELESAQIDTIHAFCAALLRRHAVEAGLDPRFEVIDAAQSALWRSEVLETVLESTLRQADEATLDLFARYDFRGVRDRLSALAATIGPTGAALWTDGDAQRLVERLLDRWQRYFQQTVLPAERTRLSQSSPVRRLRALIADPPTSSVKARERFAVLAALSDGDLSTLSADRWRELREAAKVQGLSKKDFVAESGYTEFKEAAKEFRGQIDKLLAIQFDREAARPAAEDGLALLRIAVEAAEQYRERKESEGVLDFDDLLIRARDLLTGNPDLRRRLSRRVRLLLVDEFQDTDSVQVELVRALCGDALTGGKLFFVGDYKQSIYRFRGAQPEVFRGLSDEMPSAGRLPLSVNFRSQPAIIEFVNALFAAAMNPYEPLVASRGDLSDEPLVEFLWALPDETDSVAGSVQAADTAGESTNSSEEGADDEAAQKVKEPVEAVRCREAERIARRINEMIGRGRPLVGEKQQDNSWIARPPRYKDVVVLFRALSDVVLYERALRDRGIPYYLVGGKAFYSQEEVFDLANLLRAIDDPADDGALFGALRSPIFNLLDETLVALKLGRPSLNDALFETAAAWTSDLRPIAGPADAISARQKQAVTRAAAVLGELRAMKDRVPVAVLVREALARTGFDAALVADFLGERKLANLYKLIEMAAANDAKGIFSLGDFIVQLVELVASQPDEALAATEAEQADVVRLMSIHQSKGLEFPIVFVADIGRMKRGSQEVGRYSADLGPLVTLPPSSEKVVTGMRLFKQVEAIEDEAESLRLFYVAATRAADYLVLSHGWSADDRLGADQKAPWVRLLAERFDLTNGRALAAGPKSAPRVVVRIDRPEKTDDAKPATRRPPLVELAEKAMAAAAPGSRPPTALPVSPQGARRRQFSFSRLSAGWEDSAGETEEGPPRERGPANGVPRSELASNAAGDGAREEAATLGSWAHAVLANIEPQSLTSAEAYAEWIARLAPEELDPGGDEYRLCVEQLEAMMARFAGSDRAARIAAASALHREIEFVLPWPRPLSDGEAREAERGFVRFAQGYIDCLYQEPGGRWLLIDFKTNRIGPNNRADLLEKYRMQMRLYALAVESALGQAPDEVVLHFLRTGEEHRVDWNQQDRMETEREIHQALGRLIARID